MAIKLINIISSDYWNGAMLYMHKPYRKNSYTLNETTYANINTLYKNVIDSKYYKRIFYDMRTISYD